MFMTGQKALERKKSRNIRDFENRKICNISGHILSEPLVRHHKVVFFLILWYWHVLVAKDESPEGTIAITRPLRKLEKNGYMVIMKMVVGLPEGRIS